MRILRMEHLEARLEGIFSPSLIRSVRKFSKSSISQVVTPFVRYEDARLAAKDFIELDRVVAFAKDNQL